MKRALLALLLLGPLTHAPWWWKGPHWWPIPTERYGPNGCNNFEVLIGWCE